MKKSIQMLILLVAFATSNVAFSANVSVEKARTVAINFAKQQIDAKSTDMSLVYTRNNTAYIFSNQNSWVMISDDDRTNPLLAYSA